MRRAGVSLAVILGVGGLVALSATEPLEREAGACSCAAATITLAGPDRVDDAPRNARVRVEVPQARGPSARPVVLRVHGGSEVPTSSRTTASGGALSTLELVPGAPLAAATQYEVATVDPASVPAITVFGTFRTGSASDVTAPRIDALGAASAFKIANARGEACQIQGPWVIIEDVHASDPGRPDAQLAFAVWLGDAAGNVDTRRPPTAIVWSREDRLTIGQSSLCDPHAFPIPKATSMVLGIAALDEAGNQSTLRRVRVDLAAARQP